MTLLYRHTSAECHFTMIHNVSGFVAADATAIYPYGLMLLSDEKTSVDTGAFQPGVYRVNPYDVSHEEVEWEDADIVVEYDASGYHYKYQIKGALAGKPMIGLIPSTFPSTTDQLGQQALQKAQAKLGSSDLGLGEDLGEIRETLSMLKNPLGQLRKFLTKEGGRNGKNLLKLLSFQKTGRFAGKAGKEAATAAAGTWLELRYGFRPLIMVIGDLCELANKQVYQTFDPDKIRSCRAMTKREDSTSGTGHMGVAWATWDYQWVVLDKQNAYASIQYRQTTPLSAMQELGLTPRYWPETAWELTKLSFVWDWFISIGPWLEGFRINPEITVLGNTVGTKLVRSKTCVPLAGHYKGKTNPPVAGKGSPGYVRKTLSRYKRSVNVDLPLTPLLRLGSTLGLYKTVDGLSLIIQRILR